MPDLRSSNFSISPHQILQKPFKLAIELTAEIVYKDNRLWKKTAVDSLAKPSIFPLKQALTVLD
jgi:hypothetical protein